MSGGLNRATAAPQLMELGGETYEIHPLTMQDFGMLENAYLERKPNPLKAVVELKGQLPDDDYKELLERAYKDATKANKATPDEIQEWLETREGITMSMWLSIRKGRKDFTMDDCELLITEIGEKQLADLQETQAAVSGIDELGN